MHEAIFVYIVTLAHLINNPTAADRGQVAWELAYKLAKGDMCTAVDPGYGEKVEWWLDEAKDMADAAKQAKMSGEAPPYLKKIKIPNKVWNKDKQAFDVNGLREVDMKRMQGFMKWAICLTFYYMQMSGEYELNHKDCIREIVSLSGDTDTNACIAGAAIGAYLGYNKLDQDMVKTVLECDVTGEGQIRPDWLSVGRHAVTNIERLIQIKAGNEFDILNHPDRK